jgi:hypothetical protein
LASIYGVFGVSGLTLCIQDEEQAQERSICEITSEDTGGFSVSVPFHRARSGYLIKTDVSPTPGFAFTNVQAFATYSKTWDVKLVLGGDGSARFSVPDSIGFAATPGARVPPQEALHVVSTPLGSLPTPRSAFDLTIRDLTQFDFFSPAKKADSIVVHSEDFYFRCTDPDARNAYNLQGYVFPRTYLGAVRRRAGRYTLALSHPLSEPIWGVQEFIVSLLPGQPVLLALLCSYVDNHPGADSGFTLRGPVDGKKTLVAIYPEPPGAHAESCGNS